MTGTCTIGQATAALPTATSGCAGGSTDTTAPVLTLATLVAGSSGDEALGSAVSNDTGGTFYWVVTDSATAPSAGQIQLGQDGSGAAALDAGSSPGVQAFTATGLPDGTCFMHAIHIDDAGNISNTASSAGLSKDATAPALTLPTIAAGSQAGEADAGVTTDEGGGVLYWVFTDSIAAPTAAQVIAGQDNLGAAALDNGSQVVAAVGPQVFTGTGLADGVCVAHSVQVDAAGNTSNVATAASLTKDSVSPVLSAPGLAAAVAPGSGDAAVTTDTGEGTLFWVISDAATAPTTAQIGAGQDSSGAAAVASGSQAVVAAGVQTFTVPGLPDGTCFAHYYQADAAGNLSSVVSSAGLAKDTTAPALTAPTLVAGALPADPPNGGVDTDEGNGTLYWVVTDSATAPTVAQVIAGQDELGAAAGANGSQAVTAAGTQGPIALTGSPSSGDCYVYFAQSDAAGNMVAAAVGTGPLSKAAAAPVLSSPTLTGTSAGATTDTADGDVYFVITGSATAPTAAQIIAGENEAGLEPLDSGDAPASAVGIVSAVLDMAAMGGDCYLHAVQDASGTLSNVVSSAAVTKAAPELLAMPFHDPANCTWTQGPSYADGEWSVAGGVMSKDPAVVISGGTSNAHRSIGCAFPIPPGSGPVTFEIVVDNVGQDTGGGFAEVPANIRTILRPLNGNPGGIVRTLTKNNNGTDTSGGPVTLFQTFTPAAGETYIDPYVFVPNQGGFPVGVDVLSATLTRT